MVNDKSMENRVATIKSLMRYVANKNPKLLEQKRDMSLQAMVCQSNSKYNPYSALGTTHVFQSLIRSWTESQLWNKSSAWHAQTWCRILGLQGM